MSEVVERRFTFEDAKSSKFWTIRLEGAAHTVHFGRIGTNGQTKTKEFDDAKAALASFEKLIKQKTKKGYVEDGAGGEASQAAPAKPVAKKKAAKKKKKKETAKDAKDAKVEESSGSADVDALDVEPKLDLEPTEWFWAAWRKTPPLERPEPEPFDLKACCKRLSKVSSKEWSLWGWEKGILSPTLSREEGHFWLRCMGLGEWGGKPSDVRKVVSKESGWGEISTEHVLDCLKFPQEEGYWPLSVGEPGKHPSRALHAGRYTWIALAALLDVQGLVEVFGGAVARACAETRHHDSLRDFLVGFQLYVLPYLTADDKQVLAEALSPQLTAKSWLAGNATHPGFWAAPGLGLSDAVAPIVEDWDDDQFFDGPEQWKDHSSMATAETRAPHMLIFALQDPAEVERHMRRLNLPLIEPEHVAAWIAHTGASALDLVEASVAFAAADGAKHAEQHVQVLRRVRTPEAGASLLRLAQAVPGLGGHLREWSEANVVHSIRAAASLAGERGKLGDAAIEVLRGHKRKGRAELIAAHLEGEAGDVVRKKVLEHEEVVYEPFAETPEWFSAALADTPAAKKPPTWIAADDLPALRIGDHRLGDEDVSTLLRVLAKAPLDPQPALLAELKERAHPPARGAFAWRLFEAWLEQGAPSKEKWALTAIGHLGDDGCALKLAPKIRVWPGESQHQRAVLGLDCLRAIGTDTALMQINGIATKLKFKALKRRGAECMEAIAKQRGMSRPELEDRIVPDCDLDERGQRIFDYGPRQFSFVLGPDLKAMVRDGKGKLRKDPPKPGKSDDAEKAPAALAEWKLLKKQIRETMKIQPLRLEQAMVTGRSWSPDEFGSLLVEHPLMTHLVRLLLWGSGEGDSRVLFRVSDEREVLDADDGVVTLGGPVRIVHPLTLSDDQKARWSTVFSDYEILPPFPQLGREVHALTPAEGPLKDLKRLDGKMIGASTLVGTLDRLGWTRGIPQDAGIFSEHSKQFPSAGVTAIVRYGGVPVGYMVDWEDQEVEGCIFLNGLHDGHECVWVKPERGMDLGDVDPVVISEVIRDLVILEGKAR